MEDKLDKARGHREKGNELFKAGEYKKALQQYARVHAYMGGLVVDPSMASYQQAAHVAPPSDQQNMDIRAMQVAVYSNMGMCYLKLKQPRKALVDLDKALRIDSAHGKSLCNKGRAYIALNNLDKAKTFLEEALEMHPDDALIRKELGRLPTLVKKQEAKEKAVWAKAFGGGAAAAEPEAAEPAAPAAATAAADATSVGPSD